MTFEEWELLAKQGIAEAQYNLGLMFSRGKEVPRDDKNAVKWYTGFQQSNGLLEPSPTLD